MTIGPRYLSDKALDNLKYYKYAAEDRSLLVKWFLGSFWNWIVSFCPLWVAPNLITATGFSLILLNFTCLVIYSPDLQKECPPWVYLSWVIGIFTYQVLDNIDGKQARRTGSSTPLGEIFDHGCDSLFSTLSVITLCASFQYPPWTAHFFMLAIMLPFYFSHWEEWHTGKLILTPYGNPTEAQLGMCVVHLITFFQGPQWWHQSWVGCGRRWFSFLPIWDYLTPIDCPVNMWVFYGFSALATFAVLDNTRIVLADIIKNGKNLIKSLLLLVPIGTNIGVSTYWFSISADRILERHTIMCIVFVGLLCSYTLDIMLMNRITRTDFSILKFCFVLPIIGLANCIFNPQYDEICLKVLFAVLLLNYAHMIYSVINELCDYLKIRAFKIVPKQKQ